MSVSLQLFAGENAKMDNHTRHYLKLNKPKMVRTGNQNYIPMIVKVEDVSGIEKLQESGAIIFNQRDYLVLACVPEYSIDVISCLQEVSYMSIGNRKTVNMDEARKMSNVNGPHNAIDLPQKYDGSGVIVGFSDIGFEPNHINFIDNVSGVSRVKKLVNYIGEKAIKTELNTSEEIANWVTDRENQWHATHVAGILAGGYSRNGYYGVATGADIVATTSDLYDACILAGVEDIIEYAKSQDKPAVINLSIGSNLGPRDGTDLFCQYMNKLGEDAVICMSSGNAGRVNQYVDFHYTETDTVHGTFISDRYEWNDKVFYGMSDFWSMDEQPFEIAMTIYDRVTKSFVYTSPYVGGVKNEELMIATPEAEIDGACSPTEFVDCFDGYVYITSQLNNENNRYNMTVYYEVYNNEMDGVLGRYCLGLKVKARSGARIEGHADSDYSGFTSRNVKGYTSGTTEQSISNIACGENIIVVGASSSRNVAPNLANGTKSWNFNVGEVAFFSGYGMLPDGRTLPHICAPGNYIVSSVSSSFVETQENGYVLGNLADKVEENGKTYYWMSECGTSMASPFASGTFALWLQADPTLTRDEILSIAKSTAQKTAMDISDPRWGAGNLDASVGLIKVLENAGIENENKEKCRMVLTPNGDKKFAVTVVGENYVEVSIYSISGDKCICVIGNNSVEIDACDLMSGVYIIEVQGDRSRYVDRLLIK